MIIQQLVPAVVAGQATDVWLTYSPFDPYAVSMTFAGGIVWTFARDLLTGPITGEVSEGLFMGIGDVGTCRDGATFLVRLESPDARAVIELPTADIACFVRLSLAAVPYGQESPYAERELDAILR